MPNNYQIGKRAEKRTRSWLEGQGYYVVESRGSHGVVDLVAIGAKDVCVVQVKSGRALSPRELGRLHVALREFAAPSCVRRQIITWTKYAREPEVETL